MVVGHAHQLIDHTHWLMETVTTPLIYEVYKYLYPTLMSLIPCPDTEQQGLRMH